MKRFNVTVNGTAYDVQVEELAAGAAAPAPAAAASAPAAAAPVAAPAPAAAAPAPVTSSTVGSIKVNSPMPGNIIDVIVKIGDKVEPGQALLILEAMKMENEVPAPQSGIVAGIHVSKGDSVDTGALLVSLS